MRPPHPPHACAPQAGRAQPHIAQQYDAFPAGRPGGPGRLAALLAAFSGRGRKLIRVEGGEGGPRELLLRVDLLAQEGASLAGGQWGGGQGRPALLAAPPMQPQRGRARRRSPSPDTSHVRRRSRSDPSRERRLLPARQRRRTVSAEPARGRSKRRRLRSKSRHRSSSPERGPARSGGRSRRSASPRSRSPSSQPPLPPADGGSAALWDPIVRLELQCLSRLRATGPLPLHHLLQEVEVPAQLGQPTEGARGLAWGLCVTAACDLLTVAAGTLLLGCWAARFCPTPPAP